MSDVPAWPPASRSRSFVAFLARLDPVRRARIARVFPHRYPQVGQREHRCRQRAAHARQGRRARGPRPRRPEGLRPGERAPESVAAHGGSAGGRSRSRRRSDSRRCSATVTRPGCRWRGGKGVATHLGVVFALSWQAGLIFIATFLVAALPTGFSSLGSLGATAVSAARPLAVRGSGRRSGTAWPPPRSSSGGIAKISRACARAQRTGCESASPGAPPGA